jgi:hypothetical protein
MFNLFDNGNLCEVGAVNSRHPEKVYKYTKPEFADDFFQTGHLRISPLSLYRDIGSLGHHIGDDFEGMTYIHYRQTEDFTGRVSDANIGLRSLFSGASHSYIRASGNMFDGHIISPPCYIVSTSLIISKDMRKKFGESIIEICDVDRFGKDLSRAIENQSKMTLLEVDSGFCRYFRGRKFRLDDSNINLIPRLELMKESNYWLQREYRYVYYTDQAVNPIDIYIPESIEYCNRIDLS